MPIKEVVLADFVGDIDEDPIDDLEDEYQTPLNPPVDEPPPQPTAFISDEDMDNTIAAILAQLGSDSESLRQASQMYNSDFFEGESGSFRRALSTALMQRFSEHAPNAYWETLARGE